MAERAAHGITISSDKARIDMHGTHGYVLGHVVSWCLLLLHLPRSRLLLWSYESLFAEFTEPRGIRL